MGAARVVTYNDGDGHLYALVVLEHDSGSLDLAVWNGDSFEPEVDVPHRDPADYGPEGGEHTWHERE